MRKLFRWPGPCVPNPWRPQWSLFPQRLFLKQAGATKPSLLKPEEKLIFCVNQMSLFINDQGRDQRDLYNPITDNYQAAGWSTDCRVFIRACENNFLQFNASETSSSLIPVIFLQIFDLHRWEIFSEKMVRREICYVVGLVLPWSWSWRMRLTSLLSWP